MCIRDRIETERWTETEREEMEERRKERGIDRQTDRQRWTEANRNEGERKREMD